MKTSPRPLLCTHTHTRTVYRNRQRGAGKYTVPANTVLLSFLSLVKGDCEEALLISWPPIALLPSPSISEQKLNKNVREVCKYLIVSLQCGTKYLSFYNDPFRKQACKSFSSGIHHQNKTADKVCLSTYTCISQLYTISCQFIMSTSLIPIMVGSFIRYQYHPPYRCTLESAIYTYTVD